MTFQQPYPAPPAPYVTAPRSHTGDVIATSLLMAVHVGGFLLVAFFSMFWVMATDSCGYNSCNLDYLTYAYVLTDLVGGAVLIAAMVAGFVLMARRRVAFWVPLAGIITQVVLTAASIGLLGNITN